jgi:hypothetical protein
MYSGSTLTSYSGRVMGTHQKIDRVARKHLDRLLPNNNFPEISTILQFEGSNGPDGIKRKSPAKDEPWHFFQPFDESDTQILNLIGEHYKKLIAMLKAGDSIRAAFEAAWLAHAVVDGLTPAHQYPYEEKLVELMSGHGLKARDSIKGKIIMPGSTRKLQLTNNWKMWGPKGLFTTHTAFEWGVSVLMAPMKLQRAMITSDKISEFEALSIDSWFRRIAQHIAGLELYDTFYESGWTIPLARRVRRQLAPVLVQAVELVWYGAALEAAPDKSKKKREL